AVKTVKRLGRLTDDPAPRGAKGGQPEAANSVKARKSGIPKGARFSVVSLFAGCGGLDLGFVGGFEFLGKSYDRTRFDIVWANEINSAACRTYRRNIGSHIVEGDVWDSLASAPQYADV